MMYTDEVIRELMEENKTLKDKIEFLTNCLDDRDESIELMKEENKMLHKEQWRLHRLWSKDTKHIAELEKEIKKQKKRIKELEKTCERYEIENNIETMQNPMDPKILDC